jgi:RHS repeat-associated protein
VTINPTTLPASRRRLRCGRRFRLGRSTAVVLASVAGVLIQVAGAPVSPAEAVTPNASPTVAYTYDAAGRLATITTATGTATYHYDAVGNVTAITRSAAGPDSSAATRGAQAAPRISSVSPATVRVGQTATITGSGFGHKADADVVRIGALMAAVLSVSPSRLRVAAPPGTGGAVTVHTPGGTATGGTVVINGAPQQTGAVSDPVADRSPLRAAAGVTALAGQVDTSRGAPLADVMVSVGGSWTQDGSSTVTNSKGQFLLSYLSPGRQTLTIDGSRLSGGRDYGVYAEPVELPKGRTSVLPWISYLTPIAAAISIASPTKRQVTLTTPQIPGLKVLIPAGTVIRGQDGQVVRSLSITRLPTGRTPMPWGPGMVPAYFTVQPGDATVTGPGLQVIYPNSADRPPGEAVSYLAENPSWSASGWYTYGTGHVSSNGREIIPTAATRYDSTDPGGYATQGAPGSGPPPGGGCQCGDPVDLSTGLFTDQTTDISLPDIEGVTLTRDFRQLDDTVRDFGIGGSDSLNLYIVLNSSGDFELVLPNGGSIEYTSTGTTGVYQAVNTPTDYAGSTLTQGSSDPDGPFTLTLRNGTQMAFGNPAFLTAITDRYGNTVAINRVEFEDASQGGGEIQTVTTPNGRWLKFTYGVCVAATSTNCVTQVTDNGGRTVSYGYNSNGQLTSVTNVDGGVTKYGWAACTSTITCTELTSITDPLGRVTKITYDPTSGLVTQQTAPGGGVWKYAYTTGTSGAITQTIVTDPDGDQSATTFGSDGYQTANTTGYGTSLAETTTSTYSPGTGLLASTTDPLGRTTTYTYDALGNPLTVTELAGTSSAATTTYTYEPTYNRLASITDPLGHKTTMTYTASTETITDPLGHVTVIDYNDRGQATSVTDALGNTTYYSYLYGDLVAIANPLGNVSSTYYDSVGRPEEVGDPDGNTSTYSYDAAGNKLTSTDSLGNTTTFTYDGDNELTSYTDANGEKTSYTYNSLGNILSETDPLGKTAKWAYDADGNTTTATDRDGNVTAYAYDALGRPTTIKYGVNGSSAYESVTTTYDKGNRPTKITSSVAGTFTFGYDNLNDITAYSSPQGSISYTYNKAGQRTAMTVSGQSAVSYGYNAAGVLTSLKQGSATTSYSYNADGKLTGLALPNGVTETNTYNVGGQLTGTTDTASGSTVGSIQYTYEADGRIATENGSLAKAALPTAVSSETYNADDELTKINGATSLSYDSDGQLTADGTNTYSWNPVNQLSSVTTPSGTYSYTYNPSGQRITSTTGGVTTSSLYDGGTLVQQSTASSTSNYLSTGAGGTVQVQNSSGTFAPLVNQTGSTTSLTNSAGAISSTYTYDPAGNVTVSGAANPDPEQFATGQSDPTGLDEIGSRYYDPAIGRFISQDPSGLASGSINPYEYAGDDPVNLNDPSGLCGSWCQGAVDVGAGFLNGATFGLFHIQPPYCGPGLGFAYGAGNILGGLAAGLALGGLGGLALDAIGGGLEAADAASMAADLAAEETDGLAAESAEAGQEADAAADSAASCGLSFSPGTKVRLASGSTVPIDRLKPGTEVLATDTRTGQTSAEPVTAVLIHHDNNLYDLRVTVGSRTAVIHTTSNHPFWDATAGRWVKASALAANDRLRTVPRALAQVTGGIQPEVRSGWMWDLTVARYHDFYVQAGGTAVLVHNCDRVIGHYPDYVEAGQQSGDQYFNVPTDIWDAMTPEEQWTANQTFLDRGIANGDTFNLATPIDEMNIPSAYANEVNYLLNNGYTFNEAGTALIPE